MENNDRSDSDRFKAALEEMVKISDSHDRRPQSKMKGLSRYWRGKLDGIHLLANVAKKALGLKKEKR